MAVGRSLILNRSFRLRGEIGGSSRDFPLHLGENSIGRSSDCGVQLSVKGVSQRHAVLTVGPDSLRLEDLSSKNGSFVNGSQVTSAALQPGDEVWIGSVELRLEEVDAGETRLAVALPVASPEPETQGAVTATQPRWLDSHWVSSWLTGLDRSITLLSAGDPRALAVIVENLFSISGAEGVALVKIEGTETPVVLAACGTLADVASSGLQLLSSLESSSQKSRVVVADGQSPNVSSAHAQSPHAQSPNVLSAHAQSSDEPSQQQLAIRATGPNGADLGLLLSGELLGGRQLESLLTTQLRLIEAWTRPVASDCPSSPRQEETLSFPEDYVAGVSSSMARLHQEMAAFAEGQVPVLIRGETGSGKELVANILHSSSQRSQEPFVAINCAALPAELMEAELFGIGRGVATGVQARRGRFLEAHGGTLFLDEIGDLPAILQPKLLRALEEKAVHPVGGSRTPIDVRIVAATHSDLLQRVEEGSFRADLYYRLAGVELQVPPLRERRDDIPLLVEHYLRQMIEKSGRQIRGISVNALAILGQYSWPGNVRELVHELRRLIYLCPPGQAIETAQLAEQIRSEAGDLGRDSEGETLDPRAVWPRQEQDLSLARIECSALAEALRRCQGNQVQAGKLLGISRTAVRLRIERCRDQS
ncbi:MAG: sigma 54-interacting transcriptional regulator [Deltaproteobacteria bacterium]|nr:sigma 54-interacting transcriptional regulator [Deltaproteobacteria bacterium]